MYKQIENTCMMMQNMDSEIIVNNETLSIEVTAAGTKQPIKIAPGEGKIPTNFMREEFVVDKAFIKYHQLENSVKTK